MNTCTILLFSILTLAILIAIWYFMKYPFWRDQGGVIKLSEDQELQVEEVKDERTIWERWNDNPPGPE